MKCWSRDLVLYLSFWHHAKEVGTTPLILSLIFLPSSRAALHSFLSTFLQVPRGGMVLLLMFTVHSSIQSLYDASAFCMRCACFLSWFVNHCGDGHAWSQIFNAPQLCAVEGIHVLDLPARFVQSSSLSTVPDLGACCRLFVWLAADADLFSKKNTAGWLLMGWFVRREKYCWLVADKSNEQGGLMLGYMRFLKS
jgi:hypothetical protein